jgi:hypothetical protein
MEASGAKSPPKKNKGPRSKRNKEIPAVTRKGDVIPFTDQKTKAVYFLSRKDFGERLNEIYERIKDTISRAEKLGKYELDEIEISVGVSGGILVLNVQGGITLRYSLPKS